MRLSWAEVPMRVLTPDRFRTITRHLAHQCIGGYRAKHAVNTPLKMQRNAWGKSHACKGPNLYRLRQCTQKSLQTHIIDLLDRLF